MTDWIGTLIQGSLLGGLYALFAIGLSITYGVMRVVNIAHGDFIVLSSYLALIPISMLGVHPFVVILPVAIVMFGVGYLLQRVLLNRTIGPDILPPLLVTLPNVLRTRSTLPAVSSTTLFGLVSGPFQFG